MVITVINVNEAPVIVRGQSFVASEAWTRDTLVGIIQASDPDASTSPIFCCEPLLLSLSCGDSPGCFPPPPPCCLSALTPLVGVVGVPTADTVFSFNILSGNIGAAFVIGTSDGRLAVSWDGALDYENIVVYNVTVSVTDNGVIGDTSPLKDTAWVIVTVTNVNDVSVLAFGAYLGRCSMHQTFAVVCTHDPCRSFSYHRCCPCLACTATTASVFCVL